MQEQLARAEPARIQIGQIPPRSSMQDGLGSLMTDQNVLHVEPQAARAEQGEWQSEFGVPAQISRKRSRFDYGRTTSQPTLQASLEHQTEDDRAPDQRPGDERAHPNDSQAEAERAHPSQHQEYSTQ